MSRITDLNMSIADVCVMLSDNNPGALTVVMGIVQQAKTIDPDSVMGYLGPLLDLDTLELYGPDIWILYKDVCGEDLVMILGVLRARQLGLITDASVKAAVAGTEVLDPEALLEQVQKRLPKFGLPAEEVPEEAAT